MSVHTTPDSNTLLLIHSDHADTSTAIVDSSPASNAITLSGNTAHSTDQKKFGGSSIEMSGGTNSSGDYMNPVIAGTAGTDSFTIDCWIRFKETRGNWTNYAQLFVNGSGMNQFEIIFTEAQGKVGTWGTGLGGHGATTGNTGTFTDWDDQNWHHFAWVRHDGNVKIYHNGQLDSTNAMTATTINFAAASSHYIGTNPGEWTRTVNAHIDEFRISLGARWTDSFVPPNKPYSVVGNALVTDVAGIEDVGSGITKLSSDIIIKSDPDEASTDSVFSVSAKDGTVLLDVLANENVYAKGHLIKTTFVLCTTTPQFNSSTYADVVGCSVDYTMLSSSNTLMILGMGTYNRGSQNGQSGVRILKDSTVVVRSENRSHNDNDLTAIPNCRVAGYSGSATFKLQLASLSSNNKVAMTVGDGFSIMEIGG
jgi:hypothetical protein